MSIGILVESLYLLAENAMKKFTISTISLAVLSAFALPVFAETWPQATNINAGQERVVNDGKIENANVGNPSATINVNIQGGTLKISRLRA